MLGHAAFAGTETQRACARRDARVAADNQWRTVYAIDASAGAWIDATAGDRVIEKTGAAFYAIDATAGDRGHTRRRSQKVAVARMSPPPASIARINSPTTARFATRK